MSMMEKECPLGKTVVYRIPLQDLGLTDGRFSHAGLRRNDIIHNEVQHVR